MREKSYQFGALPENHPDRVFYKETLGLSQQNFMFVADVDGEKVTVSPRGCNISIFKVPVYVGKNNAEALVNECIRLSLWRLFTIKN